MNLGPIAAWGLGLDRNHIAIDPSTSMTDRDGIYAIGDIATYKGKLKLILTGFAEAAAAAHDIHRASSRTRCCIGNIRRRRAYPSHDPPARAQHENQPHCVRKPRRDRHPGPRALQIHTSVSVGIVLHAPLRHPGLRAGVQPRFRGSCKRFALLSTGCGSIRSHGWPPAFAGVTKGGGGDEWGRSAAWPGQRAHFETRCVHPVGSGAGVTAFADPLPQGEWIGFRTGRRGAGR